MCKLSARAVTWELQTEIKIANSHENCKLIWKLHPRRHYTLKRENCKLIWGQRKIAIVHFFYSCTICFAVVQCILQLCFCLADVLKLVLFLCPDHPEAWGPLPLWHAWQAANGRRPTDHNRDDNDDGSDNVGDDDGVGGDGESQWRQQPPPITKTSTPPTRAASKRPAHP